VTAPFATYPHSITASAEAMRPPSNLSPFWTEEAQRRLLTWLDTDLRPRLLATELGQVIWMSAAAAALPPWDYPFSRDGEHDAGEERRLDPRLLAQILPATRQLRCAARKPEFGRKPWMVWACEVPGPGGPVLALVLKARGERPNLEVLAEVAQLTRAEIRVIEMMTSGTETAAIAETLRISLETLRTHVKHAYRKLGVTTRGELFAAVAEFLPP
jgi:DNA-binding CsgD family transcriptional regulator